MGYSDLLADRIEQAFKERKVAFEGKKMMGGLCYMVDNKMCVGVNEDKLMARVDKNEYENLLKVSGAEKMLFTKREMKGFIFVQPEGTEADNDFQFWIDKCLEYNPKAKSSKDEKKFIQ